MIKIEWQGSKGNCKDTQFSHLEEYISLFYIFFSADNYNFTINKGKTLYEYILRSKEL